MTLWPSVPPPPPPSLPSERNFSPGPKQCIFTLDTVAPCHVNKVRVFAWRFNTAADKSAQECLPAGDKGTLRGHCAIPGGVPLWSPLSTPNSSSSRPRHMSLITTSSQNKAYLLKTADCPRPRSEDNRDPARICARTHLLLQAGPAGWLSYKHLSLDRL